MWLRGVSARSRGCSYTDSSAADSNGCSTNRRAGTNVDAKTVADSDADDAHADTGARGQRATPAPAVIGTPAPPSVLADQVFKTLQEA